MEDFVNCMPDDVVKCLLSVSNMLPDDLPDDVMHLLRRQLVEDAIRASQNIVKLTAAIFLEVDLSVADDNVWITT